MGPTGNDSRCPVPHSREAVDAYSKDACPTGLAEVRQTEYVPARFSIVREEQIRWSFQPSIAYP